MNGSDLFSMDGVSLSSALVSPQLCHNIEIYWLKKHDKDAYFFFTKYGLTDCET